MFFLAHPGTNVTSIDAYNVLDSLKPMWEQVNKTKALMKAIMDASPDGVHLLCFSQGTLICRAVLSMLEHNVHNFVSLSGPQAGQFGDSDFLKYLFPMYLRDNLYKLFYTESGQIWSIANYWNDPHHADLYMKFADFLPLLNNLTDNPKSQEYKANFLRLKKLVMIGGPDDGVITPWQSSHFAYYDSQLSVVEMKDQRFYIKDSFGLKTLDDRSALHTYNISGVHHRKWPTTLSVFDCCIKQWLT